MPAKKRITRRTRTDPPADLTGMRFGKWAVLKYAADKVRYYGGHRLFTRMWLCRCDCGVEKQVAHHNLTKGQSKQCQQCSRIRHGVSSTKLYRAWSYLKQSGKLPKEWQAFSVFRQAVGDAPDKAAYLTRYDLIKPHSSANTFWMSPALLHKDPSFLKRLRKKKIEERVAHDKLLLRIRNAKSRDERIRCMTAARKAGYTFGLIGMAANVTAERVRIIVNRSVRGRTL